MTTRVKGILEILYRSVVESVPHRFRSVPVPGRLGGVALPVLTGWGEVQLPEGLYLGIFPVVGLFR